MISHTLLILSNIKEGVKVVYVTEKIVAKLQLKPEFMERLAKLAQTVPNISKIKNNSVRSSPLSWSRSVVC